MHEPGQVKMTDEWDSAEIDLLAGAPEVGVVTGKSGLSARGTPIWIVRVGDQLCVRSYLGARGRWYQQVRRRGTGVITHDGRRWEVAFEAIGDRREEVDEAYRHEYGRRSPHVHTITTDGPAATTLRVLPLGA
ncbi:DUF2255 family protein [Kineococcus indalonis]|uniref:DUF2255 family protein n=1 Tax=Kineococcus indalonis TaxID=2696566 RepID=UPI0014133433|nr:DUF2255 family protein [Kineococcus indalonis]NAZ85726.1 DUF2255 family protein [Kineococcus indalonis]